jgi:Cytochrome oxidase complex assembly protein 1
VYYTCASSTYIMTTPPSRAFAAPPPFPSRPQTWFHRNRKWVIPALIVGGILVLALFVGGLLWGVESMMRGSYAYQLAVKRAIESSAVEAKLGKPLHFGWFVSGNVNFSGTEGSAALTIPVSGPSGKGQIVVAGKKHNNHWNFETLQLDVSGQDEPIPLLDPALDTAPSPTGNST